MEIIIINDGSTDDSGEICDDYAKKDKRIIVIHQTNRGLSVARNVGLSLATGEMVAFLDPDDAYHQDFVKEMITKIHEGCELVICRYSINRTKKEMVCSNHWSASPSIEGGVF